MYVGKRGKWSSLTRALDTGLLDGTLELTEQDNFELQEIHEAYTEAALF